MYSVSIFCPADSRDGLKMMFHLETLGYSNPNAPVALLDRWYSLIRDKRPVRQDFLKAMCKAFSFEATPPAVTWVSREIAFIHFTHADAEDVVRDVCRTTFFSPASWPRTYR
jgi:hypothetical protein